MNKIVNQIVLLRHEERTDNPEFDTPLTIKGTTNSHTILNRLTQHGYKVTKIYSSPYIRCLQTILPLLSTSNLYLNVDNSLAEWFSKADSIGRVTIPRNLTTHELDAYRVNMQYKSILNLDQFSDREKEADLVLRISEFINFIENKYSMTNEVILIVGHLSILNQICNQFGYERNLEDHFDMGTLIPLNTLKGF